MKNLLVNRAVSTAKKNFNLRWLLVPILLIILGVGNVWGTSLTLNNLGESLSSTANTTVATTNITATGDNTSTYTINYYQCKKQSNGGSHAMFLTKSTSPFISNKTAMPGEIQSVTVYILTGAAKGTQYDCAFSTTEITSAVAGEGAETIAGGSNHTYTCSTSGARYFCITLGNASNGQVWKVDVTYTAGGSTKTLHFPSHKSGHSFLPNLSFSLCQCSSCNFFKCLTVALYFHCI